MSAPSLVKSVSSVIQTFEPSKRAPLGNWYPPAVLLTVQGTVAPGVTSDMVPSRFVMKIFAPSKAIP